MLERCAAWSAVGLTTSSKEDSPDSTPPARPLRSMHTGQDSIAPENSLPQRGQVRWDSVFMDLTILPRRLKLPNEHGFPRQPAAGWLGNQVLGSEPRAIPSSAKQYETRPPAHSVGKRWFSFNCDLPSVKRESTTCNSVWNRPFPENRATCEPPQSKCRCEGTLPTGESP
jgi:hypothetical protein